MPEIDPIHYEKQLWSKGVDKIAGVDEAGRGPLAGPVVAAAVILDKDNIPDGIDDSKKLSPAVREELYQIITSRCVSFGTGTVWQEEIDKTDILKSTHHAMRKAIGSLGTAPDHILVDGKGLPGKIFPQTAIISGDSLSTSIAAASIIAKVTRDGIMREISKIYPEYGFEIHKGYGTEKHINSIKELGPSPVHRKSFRRVKEMEVKLDLTNQKKVGEHGERIASLELIKRGYKVVERNYWAGKRVSEIDIVASKDNTLVFVEVKTKLHQNFGEPEEWISEKKREQLIRAAEAYIQEKKPDVEEYRFDAMAVNIEPETPKLRHIINAFQKK